MDIAQVFLTSSHTVKGKIKVFGDNVRRLRKAKKLTQEKLAEAANCHPNYLGGIERGERNPSLKNILAIAKALDCETSRLFEKVSKGIK